MGNSRESRKLWLVSMFDCKSRPHRSGQEYQFWKKGYHPVSLSTSYMMSQRLNYLHENPVRSGLVWESWHYKYSSAIDYYTIEKGLLTVDRLN